MCPYGTNSTDRLLNLKKGGQDCVLAGTYRNSFFLCEEYNYNCGYMESETDFLTIAEGCQLNMTTT